MPDNISKTLLKHGPVELEMAFFGSWLSFILFFNIAQHEDCKTLTFCGLCD